jgi:hypothetical protein
MEDQSNKRPIFTGGNPQAEIGAKTPSQERKNNGYRLGFDEMAKKWVCGDRFFLEEDGNGDGMES